MKRFKNILYVSELSVTQDAAIARAVSLAQNNQAQLTVVDVIPEQTATIRASHGNMNATDLMKAATDKRRAELDALIVPYRSQLQHTVAVLVGTKFLEVIRAVLRHDYDLVIKPSENPDWIDRLFGSEDMHLLRKCPCPVWLMKPDEKSNYECIMAAVDFDPYAPDTDDTLLNEAILGLSSSLALSDFADLHLVHACDAPEAGFAGLWSDNPDMTEMKMIEDVRAYHTSYMGNITRRLREQLGADTYAYLSPRVHLPTGSASKAIPTLVKQLQADLVVMGTVARTGIPGFIIGNTAESILDQLTCSVLALKPPGFVSPVTLV